MDKICTMIDWNDFRVFLAVAREGSVRRAAKKIGKTHATVSRHVKSLEEELNGSLFERRREGQCLTEMGQRILPLAEQVEENVATVDRIAFSEDTGLVGPVTLSLSESLYMALLYKPLDNFMQRYPMIDLNITATDELSKLTWREADVVIRITRNPPDSAYGKKIADSPLAVFASQRYLENRPARDRWIALTYEPARLPLIPARIVANADTPNVSAQMIRMGQGVGVLPCYIGDTDPELIRMPGTELIPDMQIWVLTHGDLRTNPRVRSLMDHLYEAFKEYKPIIEGKSTQ